MEQNRKRPGPALHRLRTYAITLCACIGLGLLVTGTLSGCSAFGSQPSSSGGSPSVQPAAPSEAAKMICTAQTQSSVASALGLPDLPEPKAEWSAPAYRCTYNLEQGTLVLTATEFSGPESARSHLDQLRESLVGAKSIEGLANLGLEAFQTPDGTVVFSKDSMTLEVGATAMHPALGPNLVSRSDFAYQIATNILACWEAHH